jgi:hypothetical protein
LSFKVDKLSITKGRTVENKEANEWQRLTYTIEMSIQSEHDLELAKNSGEALLDMWLKGESINKPQPPVEKPQWNPEKIPWTQTKGTRGDYERYPAEGQKIEAIPDYKALLQDLKEHKNFLFRDGYNYWLFVDLATVGRKKKGEEPRATSA